MASYVALIADASAKYAWVYVKAQTWDKAIDILEDVGAEVVENHTGDYEDDDLDDAEVRKELGVCSLEELIESQKNICGFVPNT